MITVFYEAKEEAAFNDVVQVIGKRI